MADPARTVLADLETIRGDLEDLYQDLHRHPELGLREHRTAGKVADALRDGGYDVTEGVGGTGVIGVLRNGDGPVVMARADMDALPVRERTGLPYASTVTATDHRGSEQPVMHACGHDVHVTCLIGCAQLLAGRRDAWQGTFVALFQPSEENGDGADAMIEDGLTAKSPRPEVVLAQHVLPYPAGYVGTRPGSFLSAADSLRITVHGRGAHGSMPQAAVDPVVMAAMIVLRLQTIVSRELAATTPAVVTVGSIHAGSGPNVIPDRAVIELNVRTYDDTTRTQVLDAIERIVHAECQASHAPRAPEVERISSFPPTVNDEEPTRRVADAFAAYFGDDAHTVELQTASEDMSEIPRAFGAPFTYWAIGGIDPGRYAEAARKGTVAQDIPVNHSAAFAPVIQPTLDTGVSTLTVAALAWLGS
ncbi:MULTISPECIES: M20 family metallopeptidase [Streptomyces]|uniref:Hippurate hydrolase n=1 Tax=Streptomyces clavifer TaxID=68188 RepID=A0ABS4V3I6_9ACTN|nr:MULTISPECIES: M20 family metallopeptidase [Streptomyces]MBP2358361.1 hippurate hydrolase [Streptomyces clavifer]MDX2741982.1 M20 family metallopeptidase [Streptomyces sp. NRRL_B-2557]GHA90388.1 peptidase [Streptomyces clavifer]